MSQFTHASGRYFTRSGLSEGIAEVTLTAAAAAFTAAIWLSIGAWALLPGKSVEPAVAASPAAATHVTLSRVVIVGRRDALDGPPAVTTAQNTAANPITLRQ
jgi:hypothetical protein